MNKSAIIGTLLGDAWIQKTRRLNSKGVENQDFVFRFSQKSKEFAEWKAGIIGLPYSSNSYERFDIRTKKNYKSTLIHLTLEKSEKEKLYNLFYKPKKRVDLEILNMLDDLGIAIWYMNDGSMYYNSNNCHLTLAVDGFSNEEQKLVIDYFLDKYNIKFTKTRKNIRITSKRECEKFMNIVEKYIPECMSYKILKNRVALYKAKKQITIWYNKPILQISLDNSVVKEWDSVKDAANILKLKTSTIYWAIAALEKNKKYYTYAKSKWRYK